MFKTLRGTEEKQLNDNGRSFVGETLQLEGDLRSAGSLDVAGLINGNVFVTDIVVAETGSVRGAIEASNIEINGHVEGKISADVIIIYRIIAICNKSKNNFARLYFFGFATAFFFYVAVNMSMVLGLLPIVGAPLPILSYGGSSMLSIMIGLGIVMSCKIYREEDVN